MTVACRSAVLRGWFARHPHVEITVEGPETCRFGPRTLTEGHPGATITELNDNNPMVCADSWSVPGPLATLASIALGPVALAGVVAGPVMLTTNLADDPQLFATLERYGLLEPPSVDGSAQVKLKCGALTAFVPMANAQREDIEEMYQERFGRSFYVRESVEGPWDEADVLGRPFALYRLRWNEDDGAPLLTVQAMADLAGKLGPAQMVHAFNVMNGFEETAGIPEDITDYPNAPILVEG
jgi:hypothetical protein